MGLMSLPCTHHQRSPTDTIRALHLPQVGYMSEKTQRIRSPNNTPDALLTTPIEVCGHLCYWIESKAQFGDLITMNKQFSGQFSKYLDELKDGTPAPCQLVLACQRSTLPHITSRHVVSCSLLTVAN